jgi:hypothetical protein
MGQNQSRLGIWALALITSLFVVGGNAAYADSFPRVHAGGQFFHNDFTGAPPITNEKVSFGIEGKCEAAAASDGTFTCAPNGITPPPPFTGGFTVPAKGPAPKGNFEYFNQATGMRVHGKITDIQFEPQPSASCMAIAGSFGVDLTGKPSALVQGSCRDGSCTQFQMEVVDGDDAAPNQGDWVCNVSVSGQNKNHAPTRPDSDGAEQLSRGDVEVRNTRAH